MKKIKGAGKNRIRMGRRRGEAGTKKVLFLVQSVRRESMGGGRERGYHWLGQSEKEKKTWVRQIRGGGGKDAKKG